MIWRLPDGHTYVTTPGSALLFPSLCAPTGDAPRPAAFNAERCGERTAMMPKRLRTSAQDRAQRIATERRHNRDARMARREQRLSSADRPHPGPTKIRRPSNRRSTVAA